VYDNDYTWIVTSKQLSVRLEPKLQESLRRRAAASKKSESVLVREALTTFLTPEPETESVYDLALKAGLIGCAKGLPPDLSMNRRKYLEGFGKNR
jgi:predicted transcriptional regulator